MVTTSNNSYSFHNQLFLETVSQNLPLLSDEIRDIFIWLVMCFLFQSVTIFGVVSNSINIICFVKQGFKDSINISLLGLAISDLGSLITALWSCILTLPVVAAADLPFDPVDLQHLTGAWPHATFNRVASWITALITLERCLCIALPLKVKLIVTPRGMTIVIIAIYINLIAVMAPTYFIYKLDMKYFPEKNKTIIGLLATKDRFRIESIVFAINSVFIPLSAFALVITCTIILVMKLNINAKWAHTASNNIPYTAYRRNLKVSKMIVIISILFIVCSLPMITVCFACILEPRLGIHNQYRNTMFVAVGFSWFVESINSSVNIFIYYYMSGRYRAVFRLIFCARK